MRSFVLGLCMALISTAASAQQAKALFDMDGNRPVLNICTGKQGGGYYGVGEAIAAEANRDFVINVIPTDGTMANLKGMLAVTGTAGAVTVRGQNYACHMVVAQEDGRLAAKTMLPSVVNNLEKMSSLYPEPVLLITRDSGLDDLDEFVDSKRKIAIVRDSGPDVTLRAFANYAERYQSVIGNIVYVTSWDEALVKLADKAVDGVFYVGIYDPNSGFAQQVHQRKLYFADVYSRHLDDSGVYQRVELDIDDRWSDVTTTAVPSMVGIHKDVRDVLIRDGYYDLLFSSVARSVQTVRAQKDVSRLDGWEYK